VVDAADRQRCGDVSASLAALAVLLTAAHFRPRTARSIIITRAPAPQHTSLRVRRRLIESGLPHAIELVVLAVRAGLLPAAAMAATRPYVAPPISAAFDDVAASVAGGQRFADAVADLTNQLGPIAAPLADSFAAADRYGLPLAPVLERLAGEARQRRRRAADEQARQLPVRLSVPLVLCTLPSFVLLAIVPLLLAAVPSLQH
jgi:Flp pilus assembly protein TadB